MNKQNQKPFTKNQIENDKPSVKQTVNILSGWIGNSMNAGHNRVIHFKKIMAGERHREYKIKLNIKLLTPKTPTYQKLKTCIRTYFVPNSRVWDNAEAYTAQKGGTTVEKIKEIPNLGNQTIPFVGTSGGGKFTNIFNTTTWRDSFISTYIPRIGSLYEQTTLPTSTINFPALSVLPLRGRIAIYNDFERNKEYDEERQEYKGDTVTNAEMRNYMPKEVGARIAGTEPNFYNKIESYTMRARRDNSYYTDYRTDLQGFESELPNEENPGFSANQALLSWSAWEHKIAEARSEAEMAQLNDWDVIAKIRGSQKLTEGKVQLIGTNQFDLNYSSITQNAYNTNENIQPEFQVLGQQGAYSYTEVDLPLYAGMEFKEEGYIHVIMTVTADTVFECGLDRNELNITPLDEYRPDLLEDKKDVLYKCEMGTEHVTEEEQYKEVVGFKRKFSEYFKLPNLIAGDMTTNNYYGYVTGGIYDPTPVITQKTFQFFDANPEYFTLSLGRIINKKIWLDYSDYMVNRNQAIENDVTIYDNDNWFINGQNQIFMVGVATCVAELPIDGSIATNYTQWGEH